MEDNTNYDTEYESNDNRLRWIIGNIFFTSVIFLVTAIQLYVYFYNEFKAKTLCIITFFSVFFGLLVVSRNFPLSLLTAIIFSNIIMGCANLDNLNNKKKDIVNNDKKEDKKEVKKDDKKEVKKDVKKDDKKEDKKEGKDVKKNIKNMVKPDNRIIIDYKKIVTDNKKNIKDKELFLLNEPELKKPKQNYLKGNTFKPYLTSEKNDLAYPKAPDSLKFQ